MQLTDTLSAYLYQHEILRSKLKIRDHYFKTIVRGIYENTGQILSLVQIQLAIVETQISDNIKASIANSRNLVGRAIYDLRDLGRNFCPENEILSEAGLITSLARELQSYSQDDMMHKVRVKGIPFALSADDGPVFFLIILEIVTDIINQYGVDSLEMVVGYSHTRLKISISYSGKPIEFNETEDVLYGHALSGRLAVHERLNLIGGDLVIKNKSGKRARIDVSMPYSNSYKAA